MSSGPQIVVGIDFGTTYSGFAWSLTGVHDEIEVVAEWPGGGNRTTPKVPTTVCYEGGKIRWGHETRSCNKVISGAKLLLDESQNTSYAPSIESRKLLIQNRISPSDAVADYLERLICHGKEILHRRFGDAFNSMGIQYMLTVPAVWSDKAKNATLLAGLSAGISASDVSLISEPEAAALYCLNTIHTNTVQNGDVVVVCDAGGGTVDLISYCVKAVSPLCLEEATQGTGAICGSVMLDERFEKMLQKLFGGSTYDLIPSRTKDAAMTYWNETVKPNFWLDEDEDESFLDMDFYIPFPGVDGNLSIGLENGFLAVDGPAIKDIFDPVVREVHTLVKSQVDHVTHAGKKVKAIFLVGGFGASAYLFQELRAAYPGVSVMQPPNAWSAVVRGAVQRGLDGNRVGKRIARCHYGTDYRCDYDPCRHDPSEAVWDDLQEKYKVDDQMKWYIKKGDPISEDKPIRLPFYLTFHTDSKLEGRTPLFVCHIDTAPGTLTDDTFKLCSMEYDLESIPTSLFTMKWNSKGVAYYKIDIIIKMTPTSASILFELEFNGASYGLMRTKY
ncbi:actin-like ATPase domain-containing protein [Aspergillus coremiiformis]|uniref:Actin-like ATPase domain-containing protein n=1 Tax=Aspergillus coremiiformis TaxID=138285 RepID=A0A5N6ZEP3_9EURO|nr:actin-like ATPase domain-containing protein [Aspergillus coremiiformis]